ncbi:NAD(P)H-hydrate dehydratase [Deinococcus ruber]|uniref:Bifunctional NAD(P)H-hydrate repair enzyme n=1 Tax=Deinococcus ruber TaxID=1848197 RepID=A0A918F2E1_9DEIO|nr:NAD(P)H-hydrate dehydratase [Deinococcus ruber]GGR00886.1 bifunctional NAD(P)H-hydrate repair enzyme [Deinococcus ruber]
MKATEYLLDSAGVRALDERLARAGLLELAMEHAGNAVAQAVQQSFPVGRVLLLAGGGANGGDAYVAARLLHAWGREIELLALPVRHPLTRLGRARLKAVGIQAVPLTPASLRRALRASAAQDRPSVVVDGLLGTGFTPPVRPALAELIEVLNAARLPVVAIDLPSGLEAGTATLPQPCVQAAVTVTFGGAKPALIYGPAAHVAGAVQVAGLGVPSGWIAERALAERPSDAALAARLPLRFPDAHKGTAGTVWIVGGHPGTVGAPVLSGLGALRAGAGLVTLHTQEAGVPALAVQQAPELMARLHRSLQDLDDTVRRGGKKPDALALGMGLGPDAARWARMALAWEVPTVVDADALQPGLAGAGHEAVVWTPHPGEAARLLECATPDVTRDPISAARRLQHLLGGVVVLKGGPTTIADAAGVYVARGGHPGMASAGMGDTLSGVIAALLGQGLSALDAALCGVRLHARAGELAGQQHGYGLSATDVSASLGAAWLSLTSE